VSKSNNVLEHPTIIPDKMYPPREAAFLDGIGVSSIYERLQRGEYQGVVKDGSGTRIPGQSILDRRARLPPAKFKPFKPRATRCRGRGTQSTGAAVRGETL
jgi:hypothetical protein